MCIFLRSYLLILGLFYKPFLSEKRAVARFHSLFDSKVNIVYFINQILMNIFYQQTKNMVIFASIKSLGEREPDFVRHSLLILNHPLKHFHHENKSGNPSMLGPLRIHGIG